MLKKILQALEIQIHQQREIKLKLAEIQEQLEFMYQEWYEVEKEEFDQKKIEERYKKY